MTTGVFAAADVPCDGKTDWEAEVASNGRFRGGPAKLELFAFAYTNSDYVETNLETEIRLRGAPPEKNGCPNPDGKTAGARNIVVHRLHRGAAAPPFCH